LSDGCSLILEPGLVFHMPLGKHDGNVLMSGDARGHQGIVTGALWRPEGRYFDGVDDKINCGDILSFGLSDFSFFFWVKTGDYDSENGAIRRILEKYRFDDIYDISISTAGKIRSRLDGLTINAGTVIADGCWHFGGVTYDRDGLATCYLDGEADGTTDISSKADIDLTDSHDFIIGKASYVDAGHFKGLIGEMSGYNRVLKAPEIHNIYLASKWRYQ
jgi:hypothetical protein